MSLGGGFEMLPIVGHDRVRESIYRGLQHKIVRRIGRFAARAANDACA
jgi:hypothetical protein